MHAPPPLALPSPRLGAWRKYKQTIHGIFYRALDAANDVDWIGDCSCSQSARVKRRIVQSNELALLGSVKRRWLELFPPAGRAGSLLKCCVRRVTGVSHQGFVNDPFALEVFFENHALDFA